jgi:hypothetical protein
LGFVLHKQKQTPWHEALFGFVLHKQKQTPWSESASELYRPSDRRLSAK